MRNLCNMKKMQAIVVLLEFFDLPDFSQCKNVVCVTQRAYERVLSALYGNEYPEQIVSELLFPDVSVRFFDSDPFDPTQVSLDGDHTLRDYLLPVPIDIVVHDIHKLTSFVHSDSYVYTRPNGETYSSFSNLLPTDKNVLGMLEFARCLYARLLYFQHTPKPPRKNVRTLYVGGGGQHGTTCWGSASSVLRQSTPFEYYAGDSFGSVIAVLCALDPSGEQMFFERMIQTCHSMRLDEADRNLTGAVAIEFAQTALQGYVDKTLAELDLPVDILVTVNAKGVEHAIFNRHTAPDMKLGDAVVASMSIPVIIGEHFGCFDGGTLAHEYVQTLSSDSVAVGIQCNQKVTSLSSMFGTFGGSIEKIVNLWLYLNSGTVHEKQQLVPVRDPNVSVLGGLIGTTSWHILNFQHGFDAIVDQ
jgi:hypothetical protein